MNPILIFLLVFLSLFISFGIGFLLGLYFAFSAIEEDDEEEEFPDLYCFQCEWEMSTVVKNGNLHCSNCGLKHR